MPCPVIPQVPSVFSSPILWAAIVAFTGVLLTVIVGTVANFRLARKRQQFDQDLAQKNVEHAQHLAEQKLADDRLARADARSKDLHLRRIDFQRQNLLELQVSVYDMVTNLRRSIDQMQEAFSRFGEWDRRHVPKEMNAEFVRSYNKSALHEMRSDNEEVRKMAESIRKDCDLALREKESKKASTAVDMASSAYIRFLSKSGEVIASLDKDNQ